jgi:hypothetical protein
MNVFVLLAPGTWLSWGVRCLRLQDRRLTAKTSVDRKDFVNTNIVAPNHVVFCY